MFNDKERAFTHRHNGIAWEAEPAGAILAVVLAEALHTNAWIIRLLELNGYKNKHARAS
jgi:hypothetical protein